MLRRGMRTIPAVPGPRGAKRHREIRGPGVAREAAIWLLGGTLAGVPRFSMLPALTAIYHVRSDARSIEERARAIAVEQSVAMPPEAIDDEFVLSRIVGRVDTIRELDAGRYEVRSALAAETVSEDAGQLINMLCGNSSIQDDVVLHDAEIPVELAKVFGGPRHGLQGLRRRVGAPERALTCSALKPQGLPAARLAELATKFAEGGVD